MSLDGGNASHPWNRCTTPAWGQPCPACTQPFPPSHRFLRVLGHVHSAIPLRFQATARKYLSKEPHSGAEEEEAGAVSCSRMQAIKVGGLSQCKGSLREKRGCSRSPHLLPEVHHEVLSALFQPGPSSLEGLWIPWKDSEWGTWKDPNSQPGPECSKFNRKASHKPDQHENLPVSPSPVSVHELASVCKPYTNKSFQIDE